MCDYFRIYLAVINNRLLLTNIILFIAKDSSNSQKCNKGFPLINLKIIKSVIHFAILYLLVYVYLRKLKHLITLGTRSWALIAVIQSY